MTRDPSLYAELAGFLRELRVSTLSLFPGQRIPDRASVVLTSPAEADRIAHPRVLPVGEKFDRRALHAAVRSAIAHPGVDAELVVGIDPGPRPGYAILSREECLVAGTLDGPEEVAELARNLRRRFPERALRFRVGSGDPPSRRLIVNALMPLRRPIELVDEAHTTPRGRRRPKDSLAAEAIARSRGRPVEGPAPTRITPGEIANLQRLSREGSGGHFTIPRAVAHRVLEGSMSFREALEEGERRYARSGRERRLAAARERL